MIHKQLLDLPPVRTGPCEKYRHLFEQYDWDVPTAMAVSQAESWCKATAVSPSDDHGVTQIHQGRALYGAVIYDPATNIKIAYEVKYLNGGWGHWTQYKNGEYLKYIDVYR